MGIFFGIIGGVVLACGWPGARIALALAGFFLVISLIEFLNGKFGWRRQQETAVETNLPAPGEFAPYLLRGERAFGTTLVLSGRIVLLDLREDALLEARKHVVLELAAHSEEVAANFEAFKRAEAARNTRYTQAILSLQIEWIALHDTDPQSGEVYFTRESGEDMWFCGLQGLTFVGLTMES